MVVMPVAWAVLAWRWRLPRRGLVPNSQALPPRRSSSRFLVEQRCGECHFKGWGVWCGLAVRLAPVYFSFHSKNIFTLPSGSA